MKKKPRKKAAARKTILVTGDLVWDTHIARLPRPAHGYYQPHAQTQLKNRHGGAWYLRDVIESALKVSGIKAEVIAPKEAGHEEIEDEKNKGLGGIAKGFSVWEWFDEEKPAAWRIKEFLGCQEARWARAPGRGAALELCQKRGLKPSPPHLLVIDDLGLGFTSHEEAWPEWLGAAPKGKWPQSIVAKASPPFDRPLWERLLQSKWAARLTLVVSAAALRDSGAQLRRGFSWDQTIEEVKRAFDAGGAGWPLRHCHRVVVTFGRSGAAVFSRCAHSPAGKKQALPAHLQFERFVFDPAFLEGSWSARTKGAAFGTASLMAAALVCHEMQEPQPSGHLSVSLGLEAARQLLLLGAGDDAGVITLEGAEKTCQIKAKEAGAGKLFRSAFDRALLDDPVLVRPDEIPTLENQTLLMDALGLTGDFFMVAGGEIVREGAGRALGRVPHFKCGDYFTVDREEIECLNTVRNLVREYKVSAADLRPLSIAVFGQPGSGKSFAIKQLAEEIFGREKAVLEFNLSQFESLAELHDAFHCVRDRSVQGRMPLVFWDEFDSKKDGRDLGWLKEFLAPMQDSKFLAHGQEHPFGKCIFIFAGGTCASFGQFDRSADGDADFIGVKGPDFISRLRAYLNVKGPNPSGSERDPRDQAHVVRRAVLLRGLIERHHKPIIHPETGRLEISPSVLGAFLSVEKYHHGARSMEAIVSLSRLRDNRRFGPSELPPPEVIHLHATPDFTEAVESGVHLHLAHEHIERLAAIMHDKWRRQKGKESRQAGKPGATRKKADRGMGPYAKLDEEGKDANRRSARLTLLRLNALGLWIREKGSTGDAKIFKLDRDKDMLEKICVSEHRRWMREKLLDGKAFAAKRKDKLLLHPDLVKFADLPEREKKRDRDIASAIQQFLEQQGLVLVRKAD